VLEGNPAHATIHHKFHMDCTVINRMPPNHLSHSSAILGAQGPNQEKKCLWDIINNISFFTYELWMIIACCTGVNMNAVKIIWNLS